MTGPVVLVAGLPRSGTTWVAEVLGRTTAPDGAPAHYLHEPDNHLTRPDALRAKRSLGPYPESITPAYENLWVRAFAGGPRPSARYGAARVLQRAGLVHLSTRLANEDAGPDAPQGPLIVKSVHCARSLEWVVQRFAPTVLLVERNPFGVIGSWHRLGWDDFLDRDSAALRYATTVLGVDPPPPGASWWERAAWHYGVLHAHLERARRRHPDWLVVRHETACAGPDAEFRRLADRLGLCFGAVAARFLSDSNRPGTGYSTHRLWHEQVDGGRSRLTPAEQALVSATLDRFTGARPDPVPGPEPAVVATAPLRAPVRRVGGR